MGLAEAFATEDVDVGDFQKLLLMDEILHQLGALNYCNL